MIDLKTEAEMAKILTISRRHLINLRNDRVIPHVRLGGSVRYSESAVSRAIEKLTINEIGARKSKEAAR